MRNRSSFLPRIAVAALLLSALACSPPPDPRRTNFEVQTKDVYAKYDPKSGKLQRINIDRNKDGRMDAFSYWDGAKLDRIEIDKNEDGKIDRWEHYGENQKMTRVGSSSKDDEVEDTWAYPDDRGFLARVETDTDRDGAVDKREFFVQREGVPDGRVLSIVELEIDQVGRPGLRLRYNGDGSFAKSEVFRAPARP